MQINGSHPAHAAQAYRAQLPTTTNAARPAFSVNSAVVAPSSSTVSRVHTPAKVGASNVDPSNVVGRIAQPEQTTTPTTVAGSTPPQATSGMNRLVAGRVDVPVDFNAPPPGATHHRDVLPLYNRAADRIEAGIAVRVGGSVDFTA